MPASTVYIRSRLTTLSATLIASLASGPALAQDDTAPQTAADQNVIIVTASKRSERLQDVPAAISVLSEEEIVERGLFDLGDVTRAVPGLSATNAQPGRAVLTMRGISPDGGYPTVGFFVDDIAITGRIGLYASSPNPDIFDVERIEILKGPQGTLYGASSMGGAIRIVTAEPDLGEVSGQTVIGGWTTEGGSAGGQLGAIANIPLIQDTLGLRASVRFRRDPGFVDRVANGVYEDILTRTDAGSLQEVLRTSINTVADDDVNDVETFQARLSMKWQSSDGSWELLPSVMFQRQDIGDNGFFWPSLPRPSQSTVFSQPIDDEMVLANLRITKSFDDVELTSLTAYFDRRSRIATDYTIFLDGIFRGSPFEPAFSALGSVGRHRYHFRDFTQEIRLASTDPDADFRWLVGAFYADYRSEDSLLVTTPGIQQALPPAFQPLFPNDLGFALDPQILSQEQWAGFGEVTYAFAEDWEVTLGARVFHDRQHVFRDSDGFLNGGPLIEGPDENSESGVTPKIAVSYTPDEDHLLYASAVQGFRPGGPNRRPVVGCADDLAAIGLTEQPSEYSSDTLWSYELGTKNSFLDNRVTVNLAAFFIDWSDIQQTIALSCGSSFIDNVGTAESKGIEVDLAVTPVEGWQVSAALAYTDSTITSSFPTVTANPGDRVLGVPELALALSTEYRRPLGDAGEGFVRFDYNWQSEQAQTYSREIGVGLLTGGGALAPNPAYEQQAFGVANARIGYRGDHVDVSLFADNVFNAQPLLTPLVALGQFLGTTLQPRTLGVEVRTRF